VPRLELVVATFERKLLEVECDEVTLPGSEGYLGILPGHAPLITTVRPGELRYRAGREEAYVAVAGGFCEVHDDRVTVLADRAQLPGEVDLEMARRDAQEAEEVLNRTLDESYVEVMERLETARAWIQVGSRR
jgi:F-type H+-transporting ATPase subunit epsilon